MKATVLDEPFLEFADGTHVDVRAGIVESGTLDRDAQQIPKPIRVGLLGTSETTEGVLQWLETCGRGLPSGNRRYPELRPRFPGMQPAHFGTSIHVPPTRVRVLPKREFGEALAGPPSAVVDLVFAHASDIVDAGGVDVLVIAPPAELLTLERGPEPGARGDGAAAGEDDAPDAVDAPAFHDAFKARALALAVPCQFIRPETYGGPNTQSKAKRRQSLQDEATRAWNFHTALYYKAGASPWRLLRSSSQLTTCYVGIAFFKEHGGDQLMTSVAQVFNERGEGVIVRGSAARFHPRDRTPHLAGADANRLVLDALESYRREHRTAPARLVVHKRSGFDQEEIDGCESAAAEWKLDDVELMSVRESGTKLLRAGSLPVLRGTTLAFDDASGIVYLRGAVPYFRTYPGLYVPTAFEFRVASGETTPFQVARELLELSKLNFNNTQFDGGEPITTRAARRVGEILKHVPPGPLGATRFRYFT